MPYVLLLTVLFTSTTYMPTENVFEHSLVLMMFFRIPLLISKEISDGPISQWYELRQWTICDQPPGP